MNLLLNSKIKIQFYHFKFTRFMDHITCCRPTFSSTNFNCELTWTSTTCVHDECTLVGRQQTALDAVTRHFHHTCIWRGSHLYTEWAACLSDTTVYCSI